MELIKYNNNNNIIVAGYESLAVSTRKAYVNDLHTFMRCINKDIADITAQDILTYVKQLERAGYKNSTINRKLYSLSKVLKLYKLAGLIDKNYVEELNRVKKITRAVNKQALVHVELDDIKTVITANTRTSVIINTLANTGLRLSELINIKHSDIDDYIVRGQTFKRVRIVGKRKKERFIYLSEQLYNIIRQTFTATSEYLFHSKTGRKLERANLYKEIKRTFKTYTGKEVHPHSLRHFFATHKINSEKQDIKAVSKYLGHSSTAITLDMYVDTALSAENSMIVM